MSKYTHDDANELVIILIACTLFLGLLFVVPAFSIAALNTLFGTGIPFTLFTWLSMLWLHIGVMLTFTSIKKG